MKIKEDQGETSKTGKHEKTRQQDVGGGRARLNEEKRLLKDKRSPEDKQSRNRNEMNWDPQLENAQVNK